MIKFLTILTIFIVLLNEIDAKSLDRPSKVSQRDGYEPTKDRTMRKPTPTDGYVCDDGGFCCNADQTMCYHDYDNDY